MFSLAILFPGLYCLKMCQINIFFENNIYFIFLRGLFFDLSLINSFLTEKTGDKTNYCFFLCIFSDFSYIINIASIIHNSSLGLELNTLGIK